MSGRTVTTLRTPCTVAEPAAFTEFASKMDVELFAGTLSVQSDYAEIRVGTDDDDGET